MIFIFAMHYRFLPDGIKVCCYSIHPLSPGILHGAAAAYDQVMREITSLPFGI
jgi:hypothetical protein